MEFLVYFLIGIVTSILGALPLGTVNVLVINTTIKETVRQAFKVIVPAALGEVILATMAVYYQQPIASFVMNYDWVQFVMVAILMILGGILIFGKKNCIKDENGECIATKKRFWLPKEVSGFLLGLFNPTVLIYWLFVVSFFKNSVIELTVMISLVYLMLFFVGVFLGKAGTLYSYATFANVLKTRIKGITGKINKIIGVLLIVLSLLQIAKHLY